MIHFITVSGCCYLLRSPQRYCHVVRMVHLGFLIVSYGNNSLLYQLQYLLHIEDPCDE